MMTKNGISSRYNHELSRIHTNVGWLALALVVLMLLVGCDSPDGETATSTRLIPPSATPEIGVTLATVAAPTQAIVQVTPTPSPTPSPTPTATPVIYIIEEGDTLLALAIQNNTTTDDIEALNPGIQPNLLQIGQQVVLPPPATPSFQAAAATSVPLQIEVINLNAYRTPSGRLWLVGEVVNHSPLAAENVQLQLALSDTSGLGIAAITTWVTPGIVPPESKAPFGVLVPNLQVDANTALAPPSAAVIGGQTVVDVGNRYLDLAVVEPEATIEESQVAVTGEIENIGGETADHIMVVTTFYDAQGNVAGYHELALDFSIGPGEKRPFSLAAAPPGGQVVDYGFLVEGLSGGR
ncbi:MAG: FxLYD domain-containing protein [Candidatus Promineifilaceae bacterium]